MEKKKKTHFSLLKKREEVVEGFGLEFCVCSFCVLTIEKGDKKFIEERRGNSKEEFALPSIN